jgi:hypothetical protein
LTLLHPAFSIIKAHQKAYIVLNAVFYGLVLIGMVAAAFIPELKAHTNLGVAQSLSEPGLMATVKEAYGNGHLPMAIGLTFAINLAVSLCQTTLPSWPGCYGPASRRAGYKAGVSSTARLYVLVTLALLVGAIYEAIEVIYLMPRF